MAILIWVVLGMVVGSVARRVMPGPSAGGMMAGFLVGVAGAMTGGLLGTALNQGTFDEFEARSFLAAISGTVLFSLAHRAYALRNEKGEETV
jgi:uncharacterized membrane protein YeaQ/YmgE (transglycosylase-associated protein family)